MKKSSWTGHAWILAAALLSAASCTPTGDIVIGFAASLSGKDAALGVDGRNAAELYVRQINAGGGIGGRKIKLVAKDFRSDDARIVPSDEELLRDGAVAIVGHFTSAAVNAALEFANREKITLVSPAATSTDLSGKDDLFFRTIMSSAKDPVFLAGHMRSRGATSLLIIKSSSNRSYTATYADHMRTAMNVVAEIEYGDAKAIDFGRIAAIPKIDAILVIANSIDTGTIAQALKIRGIRKPLYLSGWAGDDTLIEYGGEAVEGAIFVHQIDNTNESLGGFIDDYRAVYGVPPSFAAIET